jgi:hypothetical protein
MLNYRGISKDSRINLTARRPFRFSNSIISTRNYKMLGYLQEQKLINHLPYCYETLILSYPRAQTQFFEQIGHKRSSLMEDST